MSKIDTFPGTFCFVYTYLALTLFVTYDAGACSEANARAVRDRGLHYLFGLKGSQPTLLGGPALARSSL